MRACPLLSTILCAGLLAGCGATGGGQDSARNAPAELSPAPQTPLELPQGIPLTSTGAVDTARARVIRAWSEALRDGRIGAASALWAVPSKVQNGTPVLELSSRVHVQAFNASLPCGSVVTAAAGAPGDFIIATFRLTNRVGGDCDAATGATARAAIRVRAGRIVEWYRLPDDPDAPRPQPGAPPDIDETTI